MNNSSKLFFAFIITLLPCSIYSFSYNELAVYTNNLTILKCTTEAASVAGALMFGAVCAINVFTFLYNCEKTKAEKIDYVSPLPLVAIALIIGSLGGLCDGYKTVLRRIG